MHRHMDLEQRRAHLAEQRERIVAMRNKERDAALQRVASARPASAGRAAAAQRQQQQQQEQGEW